MDKRTEVIKIQYKGMEYEPLLANVLDLKEGDKYLFDNGTLTPEWTLCKITTHFRGIGVQLLEGRQKGKFWHLFTDRLLCKV